MSAAHYYGGADTERDRLLMQAFITAINAVEMKNFIVPIKVVAESIFLTTRSSFRSTIGRPTGTPESVRS